MNKSRLPFALILLSIAVILGICIALYVLLSDELIGLKSSRDVTPTPTSVVTEVTPTIAASPYNSEYFAYIQEGEIYTVKYDGSEEKQLTETDGRVNSFSISADNNFIAYTLAEEFGYGQIPQAYVSKVPDASAKRSLTTEAYELDLRTGESKQLLEALPDYAYHNDLLRTTVFPFAFTGLRTEITGLSYIPKSDDDRLLVFSRYEDIAEDFEQARSEESSDSSYVLNPETEELTAISGQAWIIDAQWSSSGNYVIFSDYDYELFRDTVYDLTELPTVKRVISTTRFDFGTTYTFKANTDVIVEAGSEITAQGRQNIYKEIDPASKKVLVDQKPANFNNTAFYQPLTSRTEPNFVLKRSAKEGEQILEIIRYQDEDENIVFDSSETKLGDEMELTRVSGQGDFRIGWTDDEQLLAAQWYTSDSSVEVFVYDLLSPEDALHTFTIDFSAAPASAVPDKLVELQFFY